jgi:hypothetical protein
VYPVGSYCVNTVREGTTKHSELPNRTSGIVVPQNSFK